MYLARHIQSQMPLVICGRHISLEFRVELVNLKKRRNRFSSLERAWEKEQYIRDEVCRLQCSGWSHFLRIQDLAWF